MSLVVNSTVAQLVQIQWSCGGDRESFDLVRVDFNLIEIGPGLSFAIHAGVDLGGFCLRGT